MKAAGPYVLPVERYVKESQALVVVGPAEEICQDGGLGAGRMHGGQAGDGDGVEPRPDVGREELVGEHAPEGVPEEPEGLGVLQVLPVEPLEGLDRGEGAPVDRLDLPDGDGPQDAADAVAEQPDRDDRQDDGRRAQGQVVEEVLGGKHHDGHGGVGGGRGGDGAYRVLLQVPGPVVEKRDDGDPPGRFPDTASLPPSGLVAVAAREECGPSFTGKVSNENDKGSLNRDLSRFEL